MTLRDYRTYIRLTCGLNAEEVSNYWKMRKSSPNKIQQTFILMTSSSSEDALIKTNIFTLVICLQKTSSRHLGQDQYICLGHTSLRCLQDVLQKCLQDVLKTSSRHLQDVLQRCLQDIFKMYYQVRPFLLKRLWDVFNTFLRRSAKKVIYWRIFLGHTPEKFMVSVQNLQEW